MIRYISVFFLILFVFNILSSAFYFAWYSLSNKRFTELFCKNTQKPKLKCNGKCFLAKKAKENIEINVSNTEKKETKKITSKEETKVLISDLFCFNNIYNSKFSNYFFHKNNPTLDIRVAIDIPPPKML